MIVGRKAALALQRKLTVLASSLFSNSLSKETFEESVTTSACCGDHTREDVRKEMATAAGTRGYACPD